MKAKAPFNTFKSTSEIPYFYKDAVESKLPAVSESMRVLPGLLGGGLWLGLLILIL